MSSADETPIEGYRLDDIVGSTESSPDWLPELDERSNTVYDEAELERARLDAELHAAKARTAAARHRAADRSAQVRDVLRREVHASQERLAELERQHEAALLSVREAGRAEAERIIAEARDEVARLRSGVGSEVVDVG
jgi:hypothetical protein